MKFLRLIIEQNVRSRSRYQNATKERATFESLKLMALEKFSIGTKWEYPLVLFTWVNWSKRGALYTLNTVMLRCQVVVNLTNIDRILYRQNELVEDIFNFERYFWKHKNVKTHCRALLIQKWFYKFLEFLLRSEIKLFLILIKNSSRRLELEKK